MIPDRRTVPDRRTAPDRRRRQEPFDGPDRRRKDRRVLDRRTLMEYFSEEAAHVAEVGHQVSDAAVRWLDVLVFVAALASLPAAISSELTGAGIAVDVLAWLMFVAEAVILIRERSLRDYLADRWHWIDIGIIVLTAPYHLVGTGGLLHLLGIARFARLARLAVVLAKVMRQSRSVFSRNNVPAAGAIIALVVFFGATIVFVVEGDTAGFGTFGDALWWAFVTLTTVGYGDLAPQTEVGRVAAIAVMLAGIAFLGTVAAGLAALFIKDDEVDEESPEQRILQEVHDLKAEMAALRDLVEHSLGADSQSTARRR